MSAQQGLTPEFAVGFRAVMLDGGQAHILIFNSTMIEASPISFPERMDAIYLRQQGTHFARKFSSLQPCEITFLGQLTKYLPQLPNLQAVSIAWSSSGVRSSYGLSEPRIQVAL